MASQNQPPPPPPSPPRSVRVPLREEQFAADASSGAAQAEAASLASGKTEKQLAAEAREAEHDRDQRFKGHFENIAIFALWAIAIGLTIVAIIWLFHLVAPACWHWLSDEQMDALRNLLTGGLIVGALAEHFKRRLN